MILVVNDVTFGNGSFGPDEYMVFFRASQLARHCNIPRIYIACNSGARIGLATELLDLFKVWRLNAGVFKL